MKRNPSVVAPAGTDDFARVVAIVVGIETYRSVGKDRLPEVSFARDDANAFAEVLREIYGDTLDLDLLVDENASFTGLKESVAYRIKSLSKEDLFVFYYAGHGFHGEGGNRLSAWDTNPRNIAGTTLPLGDDVLEPLTRRKHPHSLIFADACAAGFHDISGARDVVTDLDANEVEELLDSRWYCGVFLSCSPGEKSYPSRKLRHGVWTSFLLRALRGEDERALTRERWLTDSGLRDWLAVQVPRYITRELSVRGNQTPQAILSGSGTFRIRHIPPPTISTRDDLAELPVENRDEFLEGLQTGSISGLEGFDRRRGHTVPKVASNSAERWVRKLLAGSVADELQDLQNESKKKLQIRFDDMRLETDEGQGSLDTNIFRYSIEATQNPEDPTEYLIIRRLWLRPGWNTRRDVLAGVLPRKFGQFVVEFDTMPIGYDALVSKLEDIAEATGAEVESDAKRQRATYIAKDGVTFVFDLDQERLEISSGQRECLQIVDAASRYKLALSGRKSAMLEPPT